MYYKPSKSQIKCCKQQKGVNETRRRKNSEAEGEKKSGGISQSHTIKTKKRMHRICDGHSVWGVWCGQKAAESTKNIAADQE